jgi:SpoVK/Ycf46/Vps4 family AAA+-type ATPase
VNAILCFDEADALFGKRSEVTDAHDRYANIEVSYLLQKMESHEGLTILTTNMLESLDEAFLRRLAFVVNFPVPDVDERRQLWHLAWPPETPRAADIDIDHLAQEFRLTGGNIKNVALASAFLAAAEGTAVGMDHVTRALEREYEKMGKTLPAATAE